MRVKNNQDQAEVNIQHGISKIYRSEQRKKPLDIFSNQSPVLLDSEKACAIEGSKFQGQNRGDTCATISPESEDGMRTCSQVGRRDHVSQEDATRLRLEICFLNGI